jgi:IS5 family transposase
MLRIQFLQHWFNLADLSCEEALYDSASLRRFVGIDLGHEPVPDASTLLKFRRLLNEHKLGEALFSKVGQELQARGFKANTGTIPKTCANQRSRRGGVVDEGIRSKNRNKSKIRARLEHVFGVVKKLWGFTKVRYRGLEKNATRAFTARALANIYLGRQELLAQVRA